MLGRKFAVALQIIGIDAKHRNVQLVELRQTVANAARFDRSPWGVILWVEKHQIAFAGQIAVANGATLVACKCECWKWLSYVDHARIITPQPSCAPRGFSGRFVYPKHSLGYTNRQSSGFAQQWARRSS